MTNSQINTMAMALAGGKAKLSMGMETTAPPNPVRPFTKCPKKSAITNTATSNGSNGLFSFTNRRRPLSERTAKFKPTACPLGLLGHVYPFLPSPAHQSYLMAASGSVIARSKAPASFSSGSLAPLKIKPTSPK